MNKTGRLLTVPQTADRLNVGERFVRRLIAERRITFVRIGRHVRIPTDAVEAFISAGRVESGTTHRRAA
ncbi:excisionase family DNA-binding protein [Embleya sp. NBC_00888]|uniref:excisionase family DNA-binding protein n=1 Tax=unclassified Embleya TaxID=2699296 RepID=UPI0033F82675|nr:excisionase family DNA-binding protein [Embleya sp. NBC_00888]